jgi:hypothetical protein
MDRVLGQCIWLQALSAGGDFATFKQRAELAVFDAFWHARQALAGGRVFPVKLAAERIFVVADSIQSLLHLFDIKAVFSAVRCRAGSALYQLEVSAKDWEGIRMSSSMLLEAPTEGVSEVDPIEEIRLRTWARKNYAPRHKRDETLHPIILDEMKRKDEEKN